MFRALGKRYRCLPRLWRAQHHLPRGWHFGWRRYFSRLASVLQFQCTWHDCPEIMINFIIIQVLQLVKETLNVLHVVINRHTYCCVLTCTCTCRSHSGQPWGWAGPGGTEERPRPETVFERDRVRAEESGTTFHWRLYPLPPPPHHKCMTLHMFNDMIWTFDLDKYKYNRHCPEPQHSQAALPDPQLWRNPSCKPLLRFPGMCIDEFLINPYHSAQELCTCTYMQ